MRISRQLHDEFTAKLEAYLDERDDVSDKRRRISKALRGEEHLLDDQIAHVRRVLKGVDTPQLEILGMEIGDRKRDSILARILDAASRIRDVQIKDEVDKKAAEASRTDGPEENDDGAEKKEKPKKDPGLVWITRDDGAQWATDAEGAYHLTRALDGNWTADWAPAKGERQIVCGGFGLPEKEAKGTCETHRSKRNGAAEDGTAKKPEIPALEWRWVREDVQEAQGRGGMYELARSSGPGGGFTATFRKTKAKNAKILVIGAPEAKAKETCTAHHVESWADALLKNAGDGGLTHADTKGDAVARKKARPRG